MSTDVCARCGAEVSLEEEDGCSFWRDSEGWAVCARLVAHDGLLPHGLLHTPSWDSAAMEEAEADRVHPLGEFCPECELSRPLRRLYVADAVGTRAEQEEALRAALYASLGMLRRIADLLNKPAGEETA